MAELGEPVTVPELVTDKEHDENTCPWHGKDTGDAPPMAIQDGEDDAVMTRNLGGTLATNLGSKADVTLPVPFRKTRRGVWYEKKVSGNLRRCFQPVFEESSPKPYRMQFAPHHLIPGNESLKGCPIVAYLGDDSVIKNFADGVESKITKGKSVGYDVNSADNGAWLPSPYAVTMGANFWGNEEALAAIEAKKGAEALALHMRFRAAYVVACVDDANGAQFHMRHSHYSDFVRRVLEKLAQKVRALQKSGCPLEKPKGDDGKLLPPMGLKARLNALSGELRALVTGSSWRAPVLTDDHLLEYIAIIDGAMIEDAAVTPAVSSIL